ncbi:MAG: DUF3703 domain-containing protein [Burkholderiales bacterium]|nr:DUF3703 domain-containing protein [Burkholderiales bacterium]
MNLFNHFAKRISPSVTAELDAARWHESRGCADLAFHHLERAHILGQTSTALHVRTHWAMLVLAMRQRDIGELLGQVWRTAGAALKTWAWVPTGNTGRAHVSGFKPMPIPAELKRLIEAARRPSA